MISVPQVLKDLRIPLYSNAIYLTMNSMLAGFYGFFFWIVIARYYTPSEVGLAAAVIPLMGLIGVFSNFGFSSGLVRFLPSSNENSRVMINSCFTISGLTAILLSFVFLIGLEIWSPALLFIRDNWTFSASFILFSAVFALSPLMNQVFVARRNAKFVLFGTAIGGVRILFPFIFVASFGVFGIVGFWSLGLFLALLVGILFFIPRVNPDYKPIPTINRSVINDMAHFSAASYVSGIFGLLPTALLPLLIVNTLPAENSAYYYIAFTIAGFLFAVSSAICLSLYAEGSHAEKELVKNVRKTLRLVLILLIPAILMIFLFGRHLLSLFGDEYSSEGLILLQIFALSSIFSTLNGIYLTTRKVLKRLKPMIAIPAISSFIVLGLGYAFLMLWGLLGVAVAWISAQAIVSAGIGLHLFLRRQKISGYWKGE